MSFAGAGLLTLAFLGCSSSDQETDGGGGATASSSASGGATASSSASGGATASSSASGGSGGEGPGSAGRILSAYFGLDNALPINANGLCRGAAGLDGMPVIVDHALPSGPVDATVFAVTTAKGSATSLHCATLAPATDATERRTILLVGEFGNAPDDGPVRVEITGSLVAEDGVDLEGAATGTVTPLSAGVSLVLAERFAPDQVDPECPNGTQQVVQLTWQGGIRSPSGAPVGDTERGKIKVIVDDGSGGESTLTPFAIGDANDNDNYLLLCLDTASAPLRVEVEAGTFNDPGDDLNPATSIQVTEP